MYILFLNRLLNQYDSLLFKNSILTNICVTFSRFLAVIPFIILKIKSKRINRHREIKNKNNADIKLIYNDKEKENTKGKWKFILLSSITYLLQTICLVYSFEVRTNSWIFYILIVSIFIF